MSAAAVSFLLCVCFSLLAHDVIKWRSQCTNYISVYFTFIYLFYSLCFVMKNMKSGRLMHWNPWKVRAPLELNRRAFVSPLIIILIVAFPQSARCNKRLCVTESLPLHLCCHFISALQTFTFISSFNVKLIFLTWVCEWQMCDVIPHGWNQLLIIVFFSFVLRFGLSCLINWSQNGSAVFFWFILPIGPKIWALTPTAALLCFSFCACLSCVPSTTLNTYSRMIKLCCYVF